MLKMLIHSKNCIPLHIYKLHACKRYYNWIHNYDVNAVHILFVCKVFNNDVIFLL